MLHNRKYIGEYRFKDIVVPGDVLAIVLVELFDHIQERMAQNKKAPAKHKAEDEYLLTTKLYCGECGCFMVGESGTGRNMVHHYYKCVSVKHHRGCHMKSVKKDWIENFVLAEIKKIYFDNELVDKIADEAIKLQEKDNIVLPILQKQYAETEKSIKNMLIAIEQGIITESTKKRLEELESHKNDLYVKIAKEEQAKPMLTKEQIVFWLHKFRELNMNRLDHRRRLIDSFINAIFLYDDRIVITFNYKDGTKEVTFKDLEKSGLSSDLTALAAPFFYLS